MKKSTLFLSAAITTFILVILASVVLKVKTATVAAAPVNTAVPTDTSTMAPTNTALPTDTATALPVTPAGFITPQEAVFIASAAIGNTKVYSVDTVNKFGMDVYQVNFSAGNIVFVAPDGHIMLITQLQSNIVPAVEQTPPDNNPPSKPSKQPKPPSGGGDGGGGGGDD